MRLFKKYFNGRSHEYYYHTYFMKYQNLEYYLSSYSREKSISIPSNFISDSSKYKNVTIRGLIKKIGQPMCKQYSKIDKSHVVLFYNLSFYKYNIIKSFHFLNNELFFINILFLNLNKSDKKIIEEKIKSVYELEQDELTNVRIVDSEGNVLFVEDIFELSINYLLFDSKQLNLKKEKIENKILEIKVVENEFITKLFESVL